MRDTISLWSCFYHEYDKQHLLKLGNFKLSLKFFFKQSIAKQSQGIRAELVCKSKFQAMLLYLPDIFQMTSNSGAPKKQQDRGPKNTFEGARMWPRIPLYAVLSKGPNEFHYNEPMVALMNCLQMKVSEPPLFLHCFSSTYILKLED